MNLYFIDVHLIRISANEEQQITTENNSFPPFSNFNTLFRIGTENIFEIVVRKIDNIIYFVMCVKNKLSNPFLDGK